MKLIIFKKLNLFLNSSQKKKFYLLIIGNFFSTLFEMIGIGMIPLFIGTIFKIDELGKYLPNIEILNNFLSESQDDQFLTLSIIIISLFFIKNLYAFIIVYLEGKFLRDLKFFFSKKIYNYYINLPFIKYYDYNIALIQKNIIQETKLSCEYISLINIIIREALLFIGIFTLVIFFSPIIATSLLFFLGPVALIYYLLIRKKIKRDSVSMEKIREFQIRSINQVFSSLKETKILNTTKYFEDEFKKNSFSFENILFFISLVGKIPRYVIEFLIVSIILVFSIILLRIGYQLENVIPLLGLLVVASIRLIPSFNTLTASFAKIKNYEVSINIVLKELNNIDKNKNKLLDNKFRNSKKEISSLTNSIKLDNISFSFPNNNVKILENCSIDILKGQKIGIVGPSGSGKSTLLSIILGFFHPTKGKILVDDQDISFNLKNWHSRIGYIPQEIYLLDDTILKNVALGREINDEVIFQVEKALKAAEIYDFMKKLPKGINTNVGDRGVKFSGGQRQRIGIARALFRNPDVLILDEATSSLDSQVEKKFIENVFNLGQEKTIIISTHKKDTLKNCNKIYTISNKKLENINL